MRRLTSYAWHGDSAGETGERAMNKVMIIQSMTGKRTNS